MTNIFSFAIFDLIPTLVGGPFFHPTGNSINQLDAADGLPASSAAAVLSGVWEQGVACSDC